MATASPHNILVDRNFLFKNERNILLSVLKDFESTNNPNPDDELQVGYNDLDGNPIRVTAVPYSEPHARPSAIEILDILMTRI